MKGRLILLIWVLIVAITGCSPQEPESRVTQNPADALEQYFREESTLEQNGWQFYAVQQKANDLYAYVIFPSSARIAPVESELRRLCPDAKLHRFWDASQTESFELVLIKNVRSEEGKAKRLLQLSCSSDFDLEAFETSTLIADTSDEPENRPTEQSKPSGPAPDWDTAAYNVDVQLPEISRATGAVYSFPEDELARAMKLVDEFVPQNVDTDQMTVFYPSFVYTLERVPYFEKASQDEPASPRHHKYYYQNGYVRAHAVVQGGEEQPKTHVFYNTNSAPAVAIERWGHNNGSYFASVMEYDTRGFLNRVAHFSNGSDNLIAVAIYQVDGDYNNAQRFYFQREGDFLTLTEHTRHTPEGSFIWTREQNTERHYTSTTFTDSLRYRGRYPSLAPVLPMPH